MGWTVVEDAMGGKAWEKARLKSRRKRKFQVSYHRLPLQQPGGGAEIVGWSLVQKLDQ